MAAVGVEERVRAADPPVVPRGGRVARLLRAAIREPLLHFFIVGAMIFFGLQHWRAVHDARRIVITPAVAADLAEKYRLQFGDAPGRADLQRLVDAYVEEEVLFREGQAMGLGQGDEIVRRRIAQKARFVLQDRAAPPEPTEAELRQYLAAHVGRYAQPPRTSFHHLFFSPAAGGAAAARARAVEALRRLRGGAGARSVGADDFPDRDAYVDMDETEAARLFGPSELSAGLGSAPPGQWSGPYRSGYGWHLVHVDARQAPRTPDLAAIRERVREDFLDDALKRANDAAYEALKRRYVIVRQDLGRGP